jgi:hypothetical protein
MPTQEFFEEIGAKTHFYAQTIEKVYWMKKILEFFQGTRFGNDFALMGGSAIALLYGNIYRLSVDLDMDYIANPDLGRRGIDEIEDLQKIHFSIIKECSKALKLELKQTELTPDKRFAQFEFKYPSVYGGMQTVDLDLGYRYCHSILDSRVVEFSDFIEGRDIKVRTLAPEELWASKITAAIGGERMDAPPGDKSKHIFLGFKRKIRHLYDCYHLVNNIIVKNPEQLNNDLIKNLVILMGATRINDFEFFRGDLISLYSEEQVDDQLRPVLKSTMDPPDLMTMKRSVRRFLDEHIFNKYDTDVYDFYEEFSAKIFRPHKLFPAAISDQLKGMYYYDEILDKVIKKK